MSYRPYHCQIFHFPHTSAPSLPWHLKEGKIEQLSWTARQTQISHTKQLYLRGSANFEVYQKPYWWSRLRISCTIPKSFSTQRAWSYSSIIFNSFGRNRFLLLFLHHCRTALKKYILLDLHICQRFNLFFSSLSTFAPAVGFCRMYSMCVHLFQICPGDRKPVCLVGLYSETRFLMNNSHHSSPSRQSFYHIRFTLWRVQSILSAFHATSISWISG